MRPEITPESRSLFDLAQLRRRAEGIPYITPHKDGTETWFCGTDDDGEYLGWQDAEYAKAKGYTPDSTPRDSGLLALVEAVEAARAVVWRKEADGSITVVSGLEQLEVKLWAFA